MDEPTPTRHYHPSPSFMLGLCLGGVSSMSFDKCVMACLIHLTSKHSITDWVVYKYQTFISHSSGGQKVQDQGADRFDVPGETAFS